MTRAVLMLFALMSGCATVTTTSVSEFPLSNGQRVVLEQRRSETADVHEGAAVLVFEERGSFVACADVRPWARWLRYVLRDIEGASDGPRANARLAPVSDGAGGCQAVFWRDDTGPRIAVHGPQGRMDVPVEPEVFAQVRVAIREFLAFVDDQPGPLDGCTYEVARGDMWSVVAARHEVDAGELLRVNPDARGQWPPVGVTLQIPRPGCPSAPEP